MIMLVTAKPIGNNEFGSEDLPQHTLISAPIISFREN
jgi:hypothetical protein